MSVLADWQIRAYCEQNQMIWPFRQHLLNPCSLDVVIGTQIMIETPESPELHRLDISSKTEEDPWLMMPGEFLLAETEEQFNLPTTIAAKFLLKSSRAREGYQHALAAWIDNGFNNSRLTLELKNLRQHHPLPIYPGLRIGQIIFFKTQQPAIDYSRTGRYNGCEHVTPSAG
jgi:dCTP deaminase